MWLRKQSSWQVAILAFYTILLHATIAVTAEATATVTTAATVLTSVTGSPTLNQSTNKVLQRSLRVANDGNAFILCKTTDLPNTWFYDETGKKVPQLFHIKDEFLESFVALFLRGITKKTTYLCKEGDKILSKTTIKIANSMITTPGRVEMARGDDAALVFLHKGAKNITYKRHPLPTGDDGSERIKIIQPDNSTAILLIRNAAEQKSILTFKYDDGKSSDETDFYVGHTPEPVEKFECEGRNYDYMICKFSPPPNSLSVEYKITYNVDVINHKVPNQRNCQVEISETTAWILLNRSNNDDCTYLPNGNIYNFTLIGKNVLGSFSKEFLINNHEHVVPAKLKIDISNITDRSANLTWDNDNRFYYKGVNYRINVKPKGFENYTIIESSSILSYEYALKNLKFANWNYAVEVSARVKYFDGSKWNEPTEVSFVTAQRRPDRAPRTFPGSFYIHENNITLYWEELAPYEMNGENFTYIIRDLSTNTSPEDSLKTTKTSIDLPWSGQAKIYSIYAKNAAGMSQTGNTIRVKLPVNEKKPQYIEQLVLEKGSFKLLWKYANDVPKPSNYTVFWCKALFMMATECEGAMHFKEVSSNTNEFILDSKEPQIMALAANYPSGSTRLRWRTCFANLNEQLSEINQIEARAESAKEISLRWDGKNCVNAFDIYNITYCEVRDEMLDPMDLNCHHTSITSEQERSLTLHGLKEYTVYNISIQALGTNNRKSPMSKSIICRTNEAAPEPPRNINYMRGSITSTSVNITWDAPMVTNGVLRNYTIWYKMENETNYKEKTISANERSGEIVELNSGSIYEIFVTAWTTEQSTASELIRITTMIGIPSHPAVTKLEKRGDHYILNWTLPETRAGHVNLYELIFIEHEKKSILTVKRISGGSQICRLKFPDCTEGIQTMEVRAINLVTRDQLDRNRFRIAETSEEEKLRRDRRHSDPAYPTSQVYTQATTNTNDKRNSTDTTSKESTTSPSHNEKQLIEVYRYKAHKDFECEELSSSLSMNLPNDAREEYYMLPSEPNQNSTQYRCAQFPWQYMAAIFIFFMMSITSLIWGYNKIHEKRNINVTLPDSILQLMSMSIKLPTDIEINKTDNISIVSTKTNDSKSLINKNSHYTNQHSSASSSGESGVGGIGGDDSVSPSTSSEDVNGEFTRGWSQDEPASPQTTTTLNSLSHSSPAHHGTPTLQCRNDGITMNDDYLLVEQITNNKLLPIMDDRSISSASSYLPLHSIRSGSSSASESGAGNIINVGNYIAVGDIVGLTKDNANTAILKNHSKPIFIQAKSSLTHPNIIKNLPITTGDYVLPDSLVRLSASHNSHMEPVQPNLLKTGDYVLPDALSKMTTSHDSMMKNVNNKPENSFQTQFLPTRTSGAVEPNFSKNLRLTTGDYVLPDSLPKLAASFPTKEENQNSQKTFQTQHFNGKPTHIQTNDFRNVTLATGDYVTPDALPKIAASFTLKAENDKSKNPLEKQHLNGRPSLCKNLTLATGDYVTLDALPKIARTNAAVSAAAAAAATATTTTDHEDSKKPLQQQTKSPIVSYGYVTSDFWAQQQSAMK